MNICYSCGQVLIDCDCTPEEIDVMNQQHEENEENN